MKTQVSLYIITLYTLLSICLPVSSCSVAIQQDKAPADYGQRNDSLLALARSGDLVLRCGKDEISKLFCRLNRRDQRFSHCGLLTCTDSGQYVTHIIGGSENPDGGMVYEPVSVFIRPESNTRWALVRYDLDSEKRNDLLTVLQQFSLRPVHFDAAFDLATDEQMYCSEMVCKALAEAAKDSVYITHSIGRWGKPYIGIDDLFDNNHSKTVCEVSYK